MHLRGYECLPFFSPFMQKKKLSLLRPLHFDIPPCHIERLKQVLMWEYMVLLDVSPKFSGDLKPYFYSFSCYGYLWQGS